MFGKKKVAKPKREHANRNLAQYGLFDVNMEPESVDDADSDLEAELDELMGGSAPQPRPKPIPDVNLDAMVAESMKDIPSDAELSGDDDDPDLLNELSKITGEDHEEEAVNEAKGEESSDQTQLLIQRLKMYEEAEQNAKSTGETSRARRFNRGIKTLHDLIKQSKAGKVVSNDDIPPEVSVKRQEPAPDNQGEALPVRPAPSPPKTEPSPPPEPSPVSPKTEAPPQIDQSLLNMLDERKRDFKVAALKAKKTGDSRLALSYIKIVKQFDHVIEAAKSGQPVDLSRMPEPPKEPQEKVEEDQKQTDAVPEIPVPESVPEEPLITASSIEEALEQRLEVYQKQEAAAKEQNNSSKARRMGRIVKQFQDAIKAHKAGKTVQFDELPTPPGYAPILAEKPVEKSPAKPESPSKDAPSTSHTTRITGNQMPNSRADKQLAFLLAKQREFKLAALTAKKKGEMEQAKELLRTAKGFDKLIDASSCGLPVDLTSIPVSPTAKSQLDEEYDIVMADDSAEDSTGDSDVMSRLESQLTKQLKMCLSTRDHHKALGDVAGMNRFERLALNVTKDLDLIRLAKRTQNTKLPKFHYEMKEFAIVKSFTDLGDNDLELTVIRGISYTCANPKEIDTYVKFDFPYPQETPFGSKTTTVKDTNSPEYNQTFTIPIQRTARACQRVFKRHAIKMEVYSRGCWGASDYACCFSGFFRGDSLIGTVNVKLQHLETQCELHDSFDLMEGRKKVGGKLEVKLRLRHPIVSQQVEQIREKWLIIDS